MPGVPLPGTGDTVPAVGPRPVAGRVLAGRTGPVVPGHGVAVGLVTGPRRGSRPLAPTVEGAEEAMAPVDDGVVGVGGRLPVVTLTVVVLLPTRPPTYVRPLVQTVVRVTPGPRGPDGGRHVAVGRAAADAETVALDTRPTTPALGRRPAPRAALAVTAVVLATRRLVVPSDAGGPVGLHAQAQVDKEGGPVIVAPVEPRTPGVRPSGQGPCPRGTPPATPVAARPKARPTPRADECPLAVGDAVAEVVLIYVAGVEIGPVGLRRAFVARVVRLTPQVVAVPVRPARPPTEVARAVVEAGVVVRRRPTATFPSSEGPEPGGKFMGTMKPWL